MNVAKIIDGIVKDGGVIVEHVTTGSEYLVFKSSDRHFYVSFDFDVMWIWRCHRRHNDSQADGWTLGHSTSSGKTYRTIANFVKRNTR